MYFILLSMDIDSTNKDREKVIRARNKTSLVYNCLIGGFAGDFIGSIAAMYARKDLLNNLDIEVYDKELILYNKINKKYQWGGIVLGTLAGYLFTAREDNQTPYTKINTPYADLQGKIKSNSISTEKNIIS